MNPSTHYIIEHFSLAKYEAENFSVVENRNWSSYGSFRESYRCVQGRCIAGRFWTQYSARTAANRRCPRPPLLFKFGICLLRIRSDAASITVDLVQFGADFHFKMTSVVPFCVFCSKKSGKLNEFNDVKLQKCIAILEVRKGAKLNLANVVLPEKTNNFQKYHSQCYNRFTALPPKQRGYDSKNQVPSSSRR